MLFYLAHKKDKSQLVEMCPFHNLPCIYLDLRPYSKWYSLNNNQEMGELKKMNRVLERKRDMLTNLTNNFTLKLSK